MNNDFFKKQTALTSAKTEVYKEYITGYLPKLLITYGKCLLIDFFCGAGKNGKENGSPLILIDRLGYILTSKALSGNNNLKVEILLNDQDSENIYNLKNEFKKINYDKSIISVAIKNEKYETLLPEIIEKIKTVSIPKFFFLDPYTYSNVKIRELKELMHLRNTEVLLFIPIFHSYRFSKANFNANHKTRIFIEEYTTRGMDDYNGINDFMSSVREKILNETNVRYVRNVLLDGGGSKNALFLLTNHQKGMLLMNKVALRLTDDGNRIKVNNKNQGVLFSVSQLSNSFDSFKQNLGKKLQERELSNNEIVDFAISEGFTPKLAKEVIKELYDIKKIKVFDNFGQEIDKTNQWNIAESICKQTFFKWVNNEKK